MDVIKFDTITRKITHLYDCIKTWEEAELLSQLAMSYKGDNSLIMILPGFNRGIKGDELITALYLANKYKSNRN